MISHKVYLSFAKMILLLIAEQHNILFVALLNLNSLSISLHDFS